MSLPSRLKSPDGKTPLKYQVEGAIFALSHFYTLNRDEPGLGKTLQALLALCMLLDKHPGKRALVICPQYLKRNWQIETEEWTELFGNNYDHKVQDEVFDNDIVFLSYYQLRLHWEKLKDEKFDLIIVDEAHNFKNPKAKQTISLLKLIDHLKPEHLLLLTGTPIKNRVPDIFIPLYLMAMGPKTENPITKKYRSYFLFCYNFCIVRKTNFGTQFTGMKNVDELKTYLRGRMIGRKKSEVLELPPIVEKYVTVEYKESSEVLAEFAAFNGVVESADSSAKAESARLKAPFTAEYVRDLLEQEVGPVVVFTDHRHPIPILESALRDYRVRSIHGGVSGHIRDQIKESFQRGEVDVLVCTVGAFSTGVTLTRSHHMVFNDLPWVPSDLQQAMDRILRIGQNFSCVYHYIVGAVVDKKIHRALKEKLRTIKKVLE